ncbi:site-2 protease family protein, partial [Escherichia coli]|nr:site-2 protease family protein [Escherichia coli]
VATDSAVVRGAVELLVVLFILNVTLAVFNLLPIPPLDGSKILSSLLPEQFGRALAALDQIGFILLFVAVFTGVFSVVFRFVMPI